MAGAAWQVTPEKIDAALERIVRVAKPSRVILFGSAARDETGKHSDADFLVVTAGDDVDAIGEAMRIHRALRGISMAADVVVVSEGQLARYANTPGLVYREACQEGRIIYDARP